MNKITLFCWFKIVYSPCTIMRNESNWINFLAVAHCEITHCSGKYLRHHFLRNQLHLRELTSVIYFPARIFFASCHRRCIATVRECNLAEWYCTIRDANVPHGTARDTHEWELKASRPCEAICWINKANAESGMTNTWHRLLPPYHHSFNPLSSSFSSSLRTTSSR